MDDGGREAWHISTSAFLKEENRKSGLVARMLSKLGSPFTSGVIGGGSSASATAILRFVSPQRPKHVRILGDVGTRANIFPRCVVEIDVTSRTTIFQNFSFPQRPLGFLTFHQIPPLCYSFFDLHSIERNVIKRFRSI